MTITRQTLSSTLKEKYELSDYEAKQLVDGIFEEISSALEDHGEVKLSGFGKFTVSDSPERVGRNPKTGEEAVISARKRITFKPSSALSQNVRDNNKA
jgi:integration host factor subunit alpha